MAPAPPIPVSLARHRTLIDDALKLAIGMGDSALVATTRYVMGWEDAEGRAARAGGKRIRPALCLIAAEVSGGNAAEALPGAVAVELVHNFSLVHDEIQDHDAERHHRPTAWALVGEAQAINVGNFLYTRAVAALADGPGDPERRLAALGVLNRAIDRMLEGQWSDLAFESRNDVTVDEYLAMVAGKTGALMGAPMEIGALLGGASPLVAAQLGRWGEQVGLAFQAQDDYLGTWGDPGQTGKSSTNDIARKKKTLPIVHGLNNPDAAAVIRRAFEESEPDVAGVIAALEMAGAGEICRDQAHRHSAQAATLLEGLELTQEARDGLAAIAEFLVDRDF